MGLLERIDAARGGQVEKRYSVDSWILDAVNSQFSYLGQAYGYGRLQTTLPGYRAVEVAADLPGYLGLMRASPVAFAAQMIRGMVVSQARIVYRNRPRHSRTPRRIWSSDMLAIFDSPWPNGTTGELLSRMEWHCGLAGNAYVLAQPGRLRVLRPDWVAVMWGSDLEPDSPGHALDGQLLGYLYANGGFSNGWGYEVTFLSPRDVAHWSSTVPDPLSPGLGASWLTPAVRELQSDRAATEHKLQFFANGASPNLVVKGLPAVSQGEFDRVVALMENTHAGSQNAYRTLYLTAGADATVIGSDMQQMQFQALQSLSDTRVAYLSRVPASLIGTTEGLAGSSLNAGNFSASRRSFGDTWVFPTLQDMIASLAPLVTVPTDSELWFDAGDIPLLREDAKDAAAITQIQMATIGQAVRDGFTPDSAIAAVVDQNPSVLKPIPGWISVQLQQAGTTPAPAEPAQDMPAPSSNGAPKPTPPPRRTA